MKHIYITLLFTMLMNMVGAKAFAYDAYIDGIYYDLSEHEYDLSDTEATVTYEDYYNSSYSGNVVIPPFITYNGKCYSVTAIGDNAFSGCRSLTSINIPEHVRHIGIMAFSYCSNLTLINIPKSVESISRGAFYGCSRLKSVTFSNYVPIVIAEEAFSGCNSLTSIVLPEGVDYLGEKAFSDCSSLTSIVIPEGVTTIGSGAFTGCSSLTSITIPESVTSIGEKAFYECSSLTSINIPESVTTIGSGAFTGCSSLTSINIPEGVTAISYETFKDCTNLTTINIPEGVMTIGYRAFSGCSSLTSINIPEGVTYIGSEAFSSCIRLTSINIPAGLTSLFDDSFSGCDALCTVTWMVETPWKVNGAVALFPNHENITLYVPYGSKAAYEAADYGKEFKEIIELEAELPEEIDARDIAQLDDAIYVEPVEGLVGKTIDLCVKMKNTLTPVGCSFKLTLPEELRLQTDADGDVVYELGNRAKKMSLTMQDWGDGSYDFALTPSSATATITGNDDTFITFHVQIPDNLSAGQYKLRLAKCLIQSKTDGTTKDFALSNTYSTLTVEDYTLGDVNGDGIITPSDAIMTLYHYFKVEQAGFNAKAADVNGDGTVTPADAIETLYMYFNAEGSKAAKQVRPMREPQ